MQPGPADVVVATVVAVGQGLGADEPKAQAVMNASLIDATLSLLQLVVRGGSVERFAIGLPEVGGIGEHHHPVGGTRLPFSAT